MQRSGGGVVFRVFNVNSRRPLIPNVTPCDMFRITPAEIDEMRASQYDRSVLVDAEAWLAYTKRADNLIGKIETAFANVVLGDGIGLLEAGGLDDYAPGSDLSDLRELDEKTDWRRIDEDDLSRGNAAPSFLDAKGLVFHLPAFICAELRGNEIVDIFTRIVFDTFSDHGFRALLTSEQRSVIVDLLRFLGHSPGRWFDHDDIETAIARYQLREKVG